MWEIRTASEDDIKPVVMQMGDRLDDALKAVLTDKVERYVRKPDRTLLIAVDGSRIMGFSCIIEEGDMPENLPRQVAEIVRTFAMSTALVVHPDHRKKGIGTALFLGLEKWAVNRGRAGNWMLTHRKGYWYERDFGYNEIGRIVSKGVEKAVMAKKFE
jgi:GNAT superfamily N-acetyltransferase